MSFEAVAEEYDAARPTYPAGIYDALGPLSGNLVLEGGAGTGIATRQLLERGAVVVPFDPGPELLRKARARTAELRAVVADGAVMPFRDASADLICFAQAWHWLDERRRCAEASRVLCAGGRWSGWWSHARADGEQWFDAHWSLIEAACAGTSRSHRDADWGAGLAASGLFRVTDRVTVPWRREVSIDAWLTDQASHSYVAALPAEPRVTLLGRLRDVVEAGFPGGTMNVPYETSLWIAEKI